MQRRSAKGAARRQPVRGADTRTSERPEIDLGPLANFLGYVVRRAQLKMFQHFHETMSEVALRPAQFSVMTVIHANPGLKQADIGWALNIKQANLVALIDELEERGWARRSEASADRRSYALHLTAEGATMLERVRGLVAEHERQLIAPIGENGKRRLIELLTAISDALE